MAELKSLGKRGKEKRRYLIGSFRLLGYLTGQLAHVSRTKAFPLPMFALWVVKPLHVILHLKLLFPKSFNSANIFPVRLFEPKFLTVWPLCPIKIRVFHQNESCLLALSFRHNSREIILRKHSFWYDTTVKSKHLLSESLVFVVCRHKLGFPSVPINAYARVILLPDLFYQLQF